MISEETKHASCCSADRLYPHLHLNVHLNVSQFMLVVVQQTGVIKSLLDLSIWGWLILVLLKMHNKGIFFSLLVVSHRRCGHYEKEEWGQHGHGWASPKLLDATGTRFWLHPEALFVTRKCYVTSGSLGSMALCLTSTECHNMSFWDRSLSLPSGTQLYKLPFR